MYCLSTCPGRLSQLNCCMRAFATAHMTVHVLTAQTYMIFGVMTWRNAFAEDLLPAPHNAAPLLTGQGFRCVPASSPTLTAQ